MIVTLPWGCLVSDNEKYTVSRGHIDPAKPRVEITITEAA